MSRVFPLLVLSLVSCLSVALKAGSSSTAPKNVLFIIADDLNTRLGSYGDPRAQTPNLDALAQRGVRFERAYCNYPVCGPSRNSLLTGLYPNTTGIRGNGQLFRQTIPSHPSLPQVFRQNGYFVARVGKLYHYNVPEGIGTSGTDDPASWEWTCNPAGVDRLVEQPKITTLLANQFGATLSWYASPRPDGEHTDGLVAANAITLLEHCAQKETRPFFLAVGFFRPHTPFVAPAAYFDQFPEDQMPLVRDASDHALVPPAALASVKGSERGMNDHQRRQAMQGYYAAVSFVDAQVGKLLAALKRLGLADNTLVVFTSDHGYHLGEHGLWQKHSVFEESARVPLIFAGPGIAPQLAPAPVALVDVFPTITHYCGLVRHPDLQGQDLSPLLHDSSFSGRDWALTQVDRSVMEDGSISMSLSGKNTFSGYSFRTTRWRYTEWDDGKRGRELYDHDTDPQELKNLVNAPDQAELVTQLQQQLRTAIASTFPASGKSPRFIGGGWGPTISPP